MPTFALETVDDHRVDEWIARARTRLLKNDWVYQPLFGEMRSLGGGYHAFDISPVYPQLVPNIGAVSLMGGSMILSALGFSTMATLVFLTGVGIIIGWNIWWLPELYQFVIWIQVRRLTGEWHLVRRADKTVLGMVAHGKV